jgi:hypothetical protein
MNYTSLKANIQDVCEQTFTDDQLALFTQQAEQTIYNAVQLASLRKNVSGVFTSGNKYLVTPADFLSVYSLAVVDGSGNYSYLINKDVNFLREAYPNPATTGLPKYYAIFGPRSDLESELAFIVGPTPGSGYSTELHYYYYPESIVTAGTSWLGDNFDSALLNGALVEAIRFMKGEDAMVQLYTKMFLDSLTLLKQLGDGKQRADAYRSGQVRVQVK